jgi:DNA-directed RNA polymerase alpha subunit
MKEQKEDHPFNKLSKPAQRALANAGITNIEQLSSLKESDLMKLHGIGKKGLQMLKLIMANPNITLKQH